MRCFVLHFFPSLTRCYSALLMRGFLTQIDQWKTDWTVAFMMDPNDPGDVIRFKMREFYAS